MHTPVTCNDLNACTTDSCSGGVCVYNPLDCSDGNSCTTDSCSGGACIHTPLNCNDGNSCTTDSCSGGVCSNIPIVCNDGNSCTTDICSGGVCSNIPIVCNDGNSCTTDSCSGGSCVYTPLSCSDGNACTVDSCSGGVCSHTPITCNDGNLCTTDSCSGGVCVYTPIACNDLNACTTDSCNSGTGTCVYTPLSCSDGNSCTVDSCSGGVCSNVPIVCNDGNSCTIDSCSGGACVYTPMVCNDGNSCTTDSCSGGVCVYTPITCNDGNACTTDSCNAGVCVYTPFACTNSDGCCPTGCNIGNDNDCTTCTADSQCNDGNACTNNICSGGICTYPAINCNDGNACTTDSCSGGVCSHTPINCNDGNACTTDSCSGGVCSHTPINCNDGNACTIDGCSGGLCLHNPVDCNDGNVCTTDSCSGGSCVNTVIGGCCTASSQCNDGNVCTTDICSGNSCFNSVIVGCCLVSGECNDGSVCTTDVCSGNVCVNTLLGCINNDGCCPGGICNMGNDNDCTTCTASSQCDDGIGCTNNVCLGGTCTYPVISSCTNGDGCCPSGCNAVNDDFCSAVCSNGVIEGIEVCDCGLDQVCTLAEGANCETFLGAGAVGTLRCTNSCSTYNSSECIPPCNLTAAYWNPTSAVSGDSVSIVVEGSNCDGKTINFEIRKENLIGTTYVATPTDSVFLGASVTKVWTAIAPFSGDTTPTYYFLADVSDGSDNFDSRDNSNGRLDVIEPVVECTLIEAYWSKTRALEGESVRLIVEGINCDGEEIEFEIREDDFASSEYVASPSSINYNSPNTYTSWIANWMDDSEGIQAPPPEYYFVARVVSTGNSINSPTTFIDMLEVENSGFCIGQDFCYQYGTETDCNEDLCNAGQNGVPSNLTCGETFNAGLGCSEFIDCGCKWNVTSSVCETNWIAESDCVAVNDIGNCTYTQEDTDDCEDGILTRSLIASWVWSPLNPSHSDPLASRPKCYNIQDSIICPAAAPLEFFGIIQTIASIVIIALIYLFFVHPKTKKNKKKNLKK